MIYTAGPVNVTAGAYLVDLKDYVSTTTDANKNTVYVNSGRVRYRGVEAEGNIQLGYGLSAVGNASIIRAQFRDAGMVSSTQQPGDSIPLVPTYTGLLGALYSNGPWGASLITKFVGTEYQAAGAVRPATTAVSRRISTRT
ncbi:TonB-dependent receptor domain-containing protein [Roseateles sp. GG27B]